MPQIGHDAQLTITIGASQLQRFARIVRYGKRRNLQFSAGQCLPVTHFSNPRLQGLPVRVLNSQPCASTHPNGGVVTFDKAACAANVIAMLVGDEDCIKRFGMCACFFKARF
jgi:hypothetical protein